MRFIGVEVEQETSAPPPRKNPGSAPVLPYNLLRFFCCAGVRTNSNRASIHYYRSDYGIAEQFSFIGR